MKRFLFFTLVVVNSTLVLGQNVYRDYQDGKVYVKFTPASIKSIAFEDPFNIPLGKMGELSKTLSKYGVTKISKPFHQANDDKVLPYVLRLDFSQVKSVNSFISELIEVPGVEYAEKVPLMKTDAVPNDPQFATAGGSVHLNQINAQNAWNVFNGNSNITVAIVDNAVMWTHVDLVANTYTNAGEIPGNNIDDDGNGYKDDVNGWDAADNDNNPVPTNSLMLHGTHCAGIAGARTDNTVGVASIGWNIKIIPIKAETNNGATNNVSAGYEGIIYAVKAKARIISCSWGGLGSSATEQSVITYAWQRGSIIFASAGNSNNNILNYPGAYNNVFCVAAVNPSNVKSSYSNYGTWVDISAPGDNILSTIPYTSTATYQQLSGTSMATPLVAGLAGLMLSKSPFMTRNDVLNCLSSTAVNIYSLGANAAFVAGNQLGAGRIDAFAAMNCASTFSALPPVANFYAFPKNTCPNTLISMIDSSLYQPTSWSWVFQGGTPAISTSSNPSVQWAAPGTYSVSLTVANASGANSITKLSYVTVAGPSALPFSEGFQAVQFLPTNWTPNNIAGDNIFWERKTGIGGFGTSNACAMFDNFTYFPINERDEMRTPKYDFSNVATARLRFDVAYARYNATFSDTLEVKMSTNCGSSWTSIYIRGGSTLATAPDIAAQFVPTAAQWRRDTVDVSLLGAGQTNVMFSFINRGHYGQPIYLDNINLVFPTPTVNITLAGSICAGAVVPINNLSSGAGSYTWNLTGGAPAVSNASVPAVSYASPGIYNIVLNASNGTSTASISQTISVIASPVLSLSASSSTICSGNSATLTAIGAGSYTWSNGSLNPIISVTPSVSTIYSVTGTNGGQCSSTNTINIAVNPIPTLSLNNQTICPGGSATLIASGALSYSWNTGAATSSIVVSPPLNTNYTVTGNSLGCVTTNTVSVIIGPSLSVFLNASPASICAGGSATLTASGANSYTWNTGATTSSIVVSPSAATTYTLLGASGSCTGSTISSITISPNPTVTLVSSNIGTLCTGASATLTANGANTYSWSNGAVGNQIVVSPTTNTIYTVIGSNAGCSNSQSINIAVGAGSLNLSINANPSSICAGGSVTITASGANTYSWNTGASNFSIIVTPNTTSTYSLTGTNGGCSGNTITTINVIPPPALNLSSLPSATLCLGQSATLTASGSYSSFVWSNPSVVGTSVVITPTASSSYSVFASGSPAGCITNSIVFVSVAPNPLSVLATTNPPCSNACTGIINAASTGGTAPYTYSLSNNTCTALPCSNLCQGLYTLYTIDAKGCNASNIFSIACTGVDTGVQNQNSADGILVYPNPAQDQLFVILNGSFNVTLYNSLGQLIISPEETSDKIELNTSRLSKGVYLLEIRFNNQITRKKLILE